MEDRAVLDETAAKVPGWKLFLAGASPILLLLMVPLAGHLLVGGWPVNYGAPVHARVIDEHTGKPLAGAVVVGRWYTNGGLHGEEILMYATEAVTNESGLFELPGMPLRVRPPFHAYRQRDPELLVFKPGYTFYRVNNIAFGERGYATGR